MFKHEILHESLDVLSVSKNQKVWQHCSCSLGKADGPHP